jgi:hypothetical protein
MEFFKTEAFKLGVVFGGSIFMGAVLKKHNIDPQVQIVCVGIPSLLVISVQSSSIENYLAKGSIAIGAGIITGKLLYDEWRTYINTQRQPLVSLNQAFAASSATSGSSRSSGTKTVADPFLFGTTTKTVFYKQIYDNLPIILGVINGVGIVLIGYMGYKNHLDTQQRFAATFRLCYNGVFSSVSDPINYKKALALITNSSVIKSMEFIQVQ